MGVIEVTVEAMLCIDGLCKQLGINLSDVVRRIKPAISGALGGEAGPDRDDMEMLSSAVKASTRAVFSDVFASGEFPAVSSERQRWRFYPGAMQKASVFGFYRQQLKALCEQEEPSQKPNALKRLQLMTRKAMAKNLFAETKDPLVFVDDGAGGGGEWHGRHSPYQCVQDLLERGEQIEASLIDEITMRVLPERNPFERVAGAALVFG